MNIFRFKKMLIHITDIIFKLKTNIQILLKIFLKNKPLFKMKDQLKYSHHNRGNKTEYTF